MGPYTRAFLITSWYFAWTVCIIWSCACQCGPSWDCWRGGSSSHIFYSLPLACIASDHRVFLITSFILNTLDFSKKCEDSTPFLRVPLSIFDVRHFPEEALKLPANFLSMYIPWDMLRYFLLPDPLIILAVSALISGFIFSSALVWRVSSYSAHLKRFPVFSGLQESQRDYSAPASDVLGSLIPDFFFLNSVKKKVYWDIFRALHQA